MVPLPLQELIEAKFTLLLILLQKPRIWVQMHSLIEFGYILARTFRSVNRQILQFRIQFDYIFAQLLQYIWPALILHQLFPPIVLIFIFLFCVKLAVVVANRQIAIHLIFSHHVERIVPWSQVAHDARWSFETFAVRFNFFFIFDWDLRMIYVRRHKIDVVSYLNWLYSKLMYPEVATVLLFSQVDLGSFGAVVGLGYLVANVFL